MAEEFRNFNTEIVVIQKLNNIALQLASITKLLVELNAAVLLIEQNVGLTNELLKTLSSPKSQNQKP